MPLLDFHSLSGQIGALPINEHLKKGEIKRFNEEVKFTLADLLTLLGESAKVVEPTMAYEFADLSREHVTHILEPGRKVSGQLAINIYSVEYRLAWGWHRREFDGEYNRLIGSTPTVGITISAPYDYEVHFLSVK